MDLDSLLLLSREYEETAHSYSCKVHDEAQLKQYYTLIKMSIETLQHAKRTCNLTIEQDFQVCMSLVKLLLGETWNLELAETYLSSLRQRLQNYKSGTDYISYWLQIEFVALYGVSMKRNEQFQYKIALKNCTELMDYLKELKFEGEEYWYGVFRYVEVVLCAKLNRTKKVRELYDAMIASPSHNIHWNGFIVESYVMWLLQQRMMVPDDLRGQLNAIKLEEVCNETYVLKLLLELLIKIYNDENITASLDDFKQFFDLHKEDLMAQDRSIRVVFSADVSMQFDHPAIFCYKNLKTLLLFLQSVSYLVNCYDEGANFSVKFLPKVKKNLLKLMDTSDGVQSLSEKDVRVAWYGDLLKLQDFYQIWERLILELEVKKTTDCEFLNAMNEQIGKCDTILEQYAAVYKASSSSVEIQLLCLMNSYIIASSNDIQTAQTIWDEIMTKLPGVLSSNKMWDCTITILWIITHFEPFTWNALPSSETERSGYLSRLALYYDGNSLLTPIRNEYTLKRSLFLQIMINYVGGRLMETDMERIYSISRLCFQMTKLQRMPYLRYIIGIWHLMNSTISMKNKEVIITKAKLETLIRERNT